MVRQRIAQKPEKLLKASKDKEMECSKKLKRPTSLVKTIKQIIVTVIVFIAAYVAGKGYLQTRVNTPYDDHKVRLGLEERREE